MGELGGAGARVDRTNSGEGIWLRWSRKRARQGASTVGVVLVVLDIVRARAPRRVRVEI